jgi:hypothetical protein
MAITGPCLERNTIRYIRIYVKFGRIATRLIAENLTLMIVAH